MRNIRYAIITGVAALALLSGQNATAQSRGLGRLNGTITSEAGEPIAGVVVKVAIGSDELEGKSDNSKDGFETKRLKLMIEKEVMQSDPIKVSLKKVA
jgi:hypothetical protein